MKCVEREFAKNAPQTMTKQKKHGIIYSMAP